MLIEKGFYDWMLSKRKLNAAVAKTNLARALRVDALYDLTAAYVDDGGAYVRSLFDYPKRSVAEGLVPAHDIEIAGDYYTGTQSLRYAINLYFRFLDDEGVVAAPPASEAEDEDEENVTATPTQSTQTATFTGDFKTFRRYVGPFCRNLVNSLAKTERSRHKGICEYCGQKAELQSAHLDGEERPVIIKKILEAHYKVREDFYCVDLVEFEKLFKQAHLPVHEHIFFLCEKCHTQYDKAKLITTADILAKRQANGVPSND